MPIGLSQVISAKAGESRPGFSVKSIALNELGNRASPLVVLDDFRVSRPVFGPHPHAGFSAITYVFEDSQTGVRSRDSLGNDMIVGPGGIVWSQAGRGMLHEELSAESGRELHGLQLFVNLSAKNKFLAPQVLHLLPDEVPEWKGFGQTRARVVVGRYEELSSPLVPAEPFTLLDVTLHRAFSFDLQKGHNALIYVLVGGLLVRVSGHEEEVSAEQSIALYGRKASVAFESGRPARFLILSGAAISEPVLMHGPFIMNTPSQIEGAVTRYRSGEMGRLDPLPKAE